MAPARTSTRRPRKQTQHPAQNALVDNVEQPQQHVEQLFLDPMSGQPLSLYVEKDVDNRDVIIDSITVRHFHAYFILL